MEIGDTVFLKSGSPELTIENIKGDIASCAWFVGNQQKRESYPINTLRHPEPVNLNAFKKAINQM